MQITNRMLDSSDYLRSYTCAIVLPLLAFFLCACGDDPEDTKEQLPDSPISAEKSSHSRMLTVLGEIAEQAKVNHPILGEGEARKLRRTWQNLPASSRKSPDPNTLQLLWQLGLAELKLGNIDTGIEHLTAARLRLKQLIAAGKARPNADLELTYRLGIAYMRKGETDNCCLRNSPDSCLLPIQGSGIHANQQGSKKAIALYTEVLQRAPYNSAGYMKAKWLLNVMYMTIGGYPAQVPSQYLIEPGNFESEEDFPRFKNISQSLGVDTFSLLGGAIVDDFTGDGYLDIVASTYDPAGQMRFFRNQQDGTFTDQTQESNLKGLGGGFNLLQADYDNDGDLDIFVLRGGWQNAAGRIPNSLLRNDGTGRFHDVTFTAGLGKVHYPTQSAGWADYDNDGDLDLYIGNESVGRTEDAPCQLFQNNGDGTFTDVAEKAGVTNPGYCKGVTWGDYNGDRYPDLYVSNLGAPNRLFRNDGDGTFTNVAASHGVTGPMKSFPVWFWDYNNDGALDLYVASNVWDAGGIAAMVSSLLGKDVGHELAHLYRGDGKGGFRDVAREVGLTQLSLPMGVNFGDLDNDGFQDFYLGTGYPDYEALMPNLMYRNKEGKRFADVTSAGGFGHLQKGHGVVFADLDNDGDQDIFHQLGGFFPGDKFYDALFENPGFENHWISVKLVGTESNRSAIGARIHVRVSENGQSRSVYRHIGSGGSFGANPLRQSIGLGKATKIELLEVFWPTTGKTQRFSNLPLDQTIEIIEGKEKHRILKLKKLVLTKSPNQKI